MTWFGINSSRNSNSSRRIYTQSKLLQLDFKSFQRVIWLWLGASGYKNLRVLNRYRRRGRGSVGPDFLVRIGEDGLDVAIQIRHWKSALSKRAVDELRGILLRDQISAGMIVCPSSISKAARKAAAEYAGRPIRLIGLESLSGSMTALGLGDSSFFRSISAMSLGMPHPFSLPKNSNPFVDFDHAPDDPQPEDSHWLLVYVLLVVLILWLLKGLAG